MLVVASLCSWRPAAITCSGYIKYLECSLTGHFVRYTGLTAGKCKSHVGRTVKTTSWSLNQWSHYTDRNCGNWNPTALHSFLYILIPRSQNFWLFFKVIFSYEHRKTVNRFWPILPYHLESVYLATASFLSVTMIPNSLLKHTWIGKHSTEHFQSLIGIPRAQTSTLLKHYCVGSSWERTQQKAPNIQRRVLSVLEEGSLKKTHTSKLV